MVLVDIDLEHFRQLDTSGSEGEEESAQDAGLCETQGGGGDGGNV